MPGNKATESHKLLQELSFVVMDLETTGGSHETDQIIEIGLVKIEQMKIAKELHYLINPEIPIPPFIQKLTSISPRKVAHAPKIADVIPEILDFIGDSIVVAHNISFDYPFLNSVLTRLDRSILTNHALCTNLMSQHLIPNILNSNLNYMSKLFSIPHKRAHRALEDAKACALLLLHFLEAFAQKGIRKVNQLYYPQAQFKLDRTNFSRAQQDEFLTVLNRLHSSAMIYFKSECGLQLAALPLKSPHTEQGIVSLVMEATKYHSITVELMGSFFEAFLKYNDFYKIIADPINEQICHHLVQRHLGENPGAIASAECQTGLYSKNFLVTHHLIPEQLQVYPLFNLHRSHPLVFRLPNHEKRLLHYVNSHLRRFESYKKGHFRHCIHEDLMAFAEQLLLKAQKERPSSYLLLNKKMLRHDRFKFKSSINRFAKLTPNYRSSYPLVHL